MTTSIKTAAYSAQLSWSERYGNQHKLERITEFPRGVTPPQFVRVYWRRDHYVLQWWDRHAKRTLSDRVDDDFVAALSKVREIEQRVQETGRSGLGRKRLKFAELLDAFVTDLERRAASGEIAQGTVDRYQSALRYFRDFCQQVETAQLYKHPGNADRVFVQKFGAFLQVQLVSPNGRERARRRPMRGTHYVLEVVRAAFEWAADPDRGDLLPSIFRNPFTSRSGLLRKACPDPTRALPITCSMTETFVQTCDQHQLGLFLPIILCGLRASEPAWLFREDLQDGWLNVRCHPEVDYLTKGQRDKRFPLPPRLFETWAGRSTSGLLVRRRDWAINTASTQSYRELVTTFHDECQRQKVQSVVDRVKIRDMLHRRFGGVCYDAINYEFRLIAKHLDWPSAATLKGFRHLFATALENSGCPETYRRFFLGHSPGRAASIHYTHLDQLQGHFHNFLMQEFADVVGALQARAAELFHSQNSNAETTAVINDDRRDQ